MPTSTSSFGVGKREAHDATPFYQRFSAPELSTDDEVHPRFDVAEECIHGDIRERDDVPGKSVALVVTSPPYFAGKQYEEELGRDGVPASYTEYLELLRTVFARCVDKLEPGGRIAVNVANLGRKPYRSLAADVIGILQDDLRLLLRGEVIWRKAEGAGGNCAWGSFRSPANPVLRDVTERVIVASKGRFDRARSASERAALGLPHAHRIHAEDFMQRTLDVWDIPPESAKRVGHPAPFPVELPAWLIGLYTYDDDLVLDPFMGSGSTLVAAAGMGRRCIGYDLDGDYVERARARLAEARASASASAGTSPEPRGFGAAAAREGRTAVAVAEQLLAETGFRITGRKVRVGHGVAVDVVAEDEAGDRWWFDVAGAFTSTRGGLLRADVVWRALGRAAVLQAVPDARPLVVLSTHLPKAGSEGDRALRANGPPAPIFDVVGMLDDDGGKRLSAYAAGAVSPLAGFWSDADVGRRAVAT